MAEKDKTRSFERRFLDYSETVGRLLGTIGGKAGAMLDRGTAAESLARIRDGASELLAHIAPDAEQAGNSNGAKAAPVKRRVMAQANERSGAVAAPGKKHRQPPPSARGVKHSDQRIAKLQAATTRGRRGNRG